MKVVRFIFILFISLYICPNVLAYEKSIADITKLTITEINNYIDEGYLTYEELIKLYLDRIDAYEEQYNALISVNENALEEARKCDEIYKNEGRKSPMFCIPVILKDNIDYVGLATTGGTFALKDSIPYENATIVQNLINNGAIILAKANMSEFAFSARDSFSSYGHVKNSYNISYTPYGSSGGSAVSVAASFSTVSIGTDTNSSIRLPASANNVVGLRPTYGLLSNNGIIAYDITRDTAGPISKTVEDNAILMTVIANNGIDYTKSLKKDGLVDKKIGVLTQFIKQDKDSDLSIFKYYYSEIDRLMADAIKKMEDAGATIIYIDDFYNEDMDNYYDNTVYDKTMCYQFNEYIKGTSSEIENFDELLETENYVNNLENYNENCYKNLINTNEYKKVKSYKEEYKKIVEEKIKKYDVDVLIYPSMKTSIPKISKIWDTKVVTLSYTISATIGFPAISVPMGFDNKGLPYGFEILARENNEEVLYEIAYAYEQLDNNIITPEIAPSLYEIPDVVLELKSLYENNKVSSKNKDFIKTEEKVKNILFNYKNYDGTIEQTQNVYNEYKLQINKVLEEQKELKKQKQIQAKNRKKIINNINIILTILMIIDGVIIIKKIYTYRKS